ncbi:MAG: hypothetical protein EAY75_10640 [Bacteroidetes bacterium]|nr:MAG: hypothetical protein EAY75_10640 [Bacteroidota bacterium]
MLNVSVAGLVVERGWFQALSFGAGAIVAEVLVVFVSLMASKKIGVAQRFKHYLNYAIIALLFFMAFSSIFDALQRSAFQSPLPVSQNWTVAVGFFLSLINPFHLPFWLGWTVILRAKQILPHSHAGNSAYLFGIAMGTAAAFLLYGTTAKSVVNLLSNNQYILNWIIGISLMVGAVFQLIKQLQLQYPKKSN